MQPARDRVGRAAQRGQVVRLQQRAALRRASAARRRPLCRAVWQSLSPSSTPAGARPSSAALLVEQLQPLLLARAEMKMQIVAQVRQALRPRQAQRRPPRGRRSRPDGPRPASRASAKRRVEPVQIDAGAGDPHGKHERQARPSGTIRRPGPRRRRTGPAGECMARSPISSTASAVVSASDAPIGSGSSCGCNAEPLVQQDPHQRRAGARAFVERQRADLLDRHAAEQLHAQHRPAAGDAGVGDDRVAGIAERTRSTGSAPRRAGRRPGRRPAGWAESSTNSACGANRSRP